jgi:hypothetical protein
MEEGMTDADRDATIEFLTEDRDQHRAAAEGWMTRCEASDARERAAQEELQRMREAHGALVLQWTEMGQALLNAARTWRETGDGAALLLALGAIDREEAAPRSIPRRLGRTR